MRTAKIIKSDVLFQWKYGIYLLYAVFTCLYIFLIYSVPSSIKDNLATILVFTDPSAMGLFFMGGILLLERSQRVNCSLAVSPIKCWQYVIGKVVSLSLIGLVVGTLLKCIAGGENIIISILGIFLTAVFINICALVVAVHVETLNQFIIYTVPVEVVILAGPIVKLAGLWNPLMLINPCTAGFCLIEGEEKYLTICILSLILWSIVALFISCKAVKKSFFVMGEAKI